MLKHKFKAKQTIIEKSEAKRYTELKALQKNGLVLFFLRQILFHLPSEIKYVCNFLVFWNNCEVTIEGVKGMRTPLYNLKKKQVEAIYPIKVTE